MNVQPTYLLMLLLQGIILASFLGFLVVSAFYAKAYKTYRVYVADLKKQGQYSAWVEQHLALVTFGKVSTISEGLFLLAMIISSEFIKHPSSIPELLGKIALTYFSVFWPFAFVARLVLARLYKKVPVGWRSQG
ncbi:MAG TPA: hypothetical protein PK530_24265 [Anaerolineales bacterium]|nr:hypothetical protein [Anaerolineales bacterium]